jgi:signal recognition particle subunit SRP54
MLGVLTEKFQELAAKFSKEKSLTENNVQEALREVRLALLEADVNYTVVKELIRRVKEKALGTSVQKGISPGQLFIKVVHDELVALMGGEESFLNFKGKPPVFMMCGLQGSGKTTQTAKLANYLRKTKQCQNPLLIACDLQRPAAVEQLKILGAQIQVPVFSIPQESDPLVVAKLGVQKAKELGCDLVIVDTAGRLHIDQEMMDQLKRLTELLIPQEVLFVANGATGQDAVTVAKTFNEQLEVTGTILTMLDGNTRGGAAISIKEVTGKPLKFEGIGEKIEDIQVFNPVSMADRILGMGDTINLVKKTQEHFTEDEAKSLEKKILSATFTYNDYLQQMQKVKKMGSLKGLLGMLPGMSAIKSLDFDEKEFFKTEAIIQSMTQVERLCVVDLVPLRRKRIAKGSGTKIEDVNKLIKSFEKMKHFFKNMPNQKQMEKLFGGARWP